MKKYIPLLLLAACGFQPMYTSRDTDIYVAPISGINGIDLRNGLNAKFGGVRDANAKYTLTVNLKNPVTRYKALESTGDATWQEIVLTASYTLTADGKQIARGTESASESYTFVRYLVAANASYNNAVQNIIQVLSEKIGTRVIAETYRYEQQSDNDTNSKQ
ncbi:MAG TPA: hypothetical protein IAD02_01465 [Candidatus Enterousia intestinigallinarum]|uniref:Lipoprotein n=1 Tax=Candidatus Enterousia intestinigallinarum TaxID=2840790 RepID=A0A9D1FGM3_9PROT|nr:hypothetical protein [Candidatus Enterousia intestinigallinarum]